MTQQPLDELDLINQRPNVDETSSAEQPPAQAE